MQTSPAKMSSLIFRYQAWSFFIDAQRAILTATSAVIVLNKVLETTSNAASALEHNQELDKAVELLAVKADAYYSGQPVTALIDPEESVVADSLKAMARIKINR